MRHSQEFCEIMDRLIPFVRERYELWRNVSDEVLRDYCAWFWNRGLLIWREKDGLITGVAIFRYFKTLDDFLDLANSDQEGGAFGWAELFVADSLETFNSLWSEVLEQGGIPEVIMWDRGDRTLNGTPRMYRRDQIQKMARRLSHGFTTKTA